MRYEVRYLDEEEGSLTFGEWLPIPLEICRPSRHCGCYDKGQMDLCDNSFLDTDSNQVAKDMKECLDKEGTKAKIVVVQHNESC